MLPRVSKKSFELPGPGPQALLIHGYTGTPYDLRPLGDFLHKENFHVCAPLLKGHGQKPELLFKVSADDWFLQVNNILDSFDKKKPVIIIGLSMGALIACAISKKVDALILCSPAFYLTML